jgi:hypothetical protein
VIVGGRPGRTKFHSVATRFLFGDNRSYCYRLVEEGTQDVEDSDGCLGEGLDPTEELHLEASRTSHPAPEARRGGCLRSRRALSTVPGRG